MPTHPRLRLREDDAPPLLLGLAVAAGAVALTTLLIYALDDVAPGRLARRRLPRRRAARLRRSGAVARASATALASALAFNFFHIPPTGRFTIRDGRELGRARRLPHRRGRWPARWPGRRAARAREADQRRQEADLAAEMARLLLRGGRLEEALPVVAHRLAQGLGLPSVALELRSVEGDDRRVAFPLRERRAPDRDAARARRAVGGGRCTASSAASCPQLEALLAAALERDELLGDAVETAALRRSRRHEDRAAARGLARPALAADRDPGRRRRARLAGAHRGRARGARRRRRHRGDAALAPDRQPARPLAPGGRTRPSRGASGARSSEVLEAAADDLALPRGRRSGSRSTRDLPQVRADAAQLERAFANLLENAAATRAATRSRCARAPSAGASSCASSTAGRASRRRSASGSSSPSTVGHRPHRPPRLRPRAGDRARLRRGQRRHGARSSRCPGRARRSSSSCRSTPCREPVRRVT